MNEDVYARFEIFDYGCKRYNLEGKTFLQTDFKPFRQYTIWGSRNINQEIILSGRYDKSLKCTNIEVCKTKYYKIKLILIIN